ncbi:LuxR C-terminal-related transcriptional regulator [Sphingomonas sp. IC-56]|uniref:helix-turn-helix transcriptional regulator n=1 Tax=Sphingomonas sp. IC-56 TaxID=2898529 RepID=UPI001E6480E0|nr:LuxR C-terminal-related transcriptional regulator [Sphingomonas sp. IC-56]MCD2324435.1 LuxR C-terminal-related transcriptional regulator [Sphingomonas sp. IC-56]
MIGGGEYEQTYGRALERWIDTDHLPRAIVSKTCRLIWANAAARNMLAARTGLVIHNGMLVCAESTRTPLLTRFVSECDDHIRGFFLADETSRAHMVLRGRLIDEADGLPMVGLIFYEDSADFLGRYMDVGVAFKLTGTEHQVVNHLLSGDTAEDITQKLNVSMATTRSHIRNIYRKLNVTSREALFKRLQPFRL